MKNEKNPLKEKCDDLSSVWDKTFDSIWCINFAPYTERKNNVISEFKRVGIIPNVKFNFYHTFDNMFERIIFDVTKNMNKNSCITTSEMNLAMAHYSCIKSSYESGCKNALIFEDDIKFLLDKDKIRDFISDIPKDADIVLFSQNPGLESSIPKYMSSDKSGKYVKFDYPIWDSGFYMISRKAMELYIAEFEKFIRPSDIYISSFYDIGDVNRYFSSTPIGIQLDNDRCIHRSHYYTYATMNIDLDDYGERFLSKKDEDIRFGIVIPAYNSENSIIRCLESIERQEYENFSVVIVDDVSEDSTFEKTKRYISGKDRFKLLKCDSKRYGGGARNVGIDNLGECDYVLFLDSDDYYHSRYTLTTIRNKIVENKRPDCILCPFIDRYHDDKLVWMNYENLIDFLRENPVNAPWAKCVRRDIVQRFEEGDLIGYDDVVQHYRQMDCVKTIAKLDNIAIVYTCDSKETVNNTKTIDGEKKRRKDIALVLTITNLINSKFNKEYVKNSALRHFVDPNIQKALEIKNVISNITLNSVNEHLPSTGSKTS